MASSTQKLRVIPSSAPKRIAKIQFGTLRTDEIEKVSELQVTSRDVYQMQPTKMPATHVSYLNTDISFLPNS